MPLVYTPLLETPPSSDDEAEAGEFDTGEILDDERMSVDPAPSRLGRRPSPALPPSPVSIPSSPSRKRPRTDWNAPAHIPDFLPPFPVPKEYSDPPSPDNAPATLPTPLRAQEALAPLPQVSTTTSSADYLTPVPYTSSSLSSTPVWHLPQPPTSLDLPSQPPRLVTPQIQPSLLGAYHHILTNPPPPHGNAGNPARHRVALALLSQTENNPRWEPADTLFGLSSPNAPRVSTMPPSHPIAKQSPMHASSDLGKPDTKAEEIAKIPLPPISNYPVIAQQHVAPSMSTQASRLPEVSRSVLSVRFRLSQPADIFLRIHFTSSHLCIIAPLVFRTLHPSNAERSYLSMGGQWTRRGILPIIQRCSSRSTRTRKLWKHYKTARSRKRQLLRYQTPSSGRLGISSTRISESRYLSGSGREGWYNRPVELA